MCVFAGSGRRVRVSDSSRGATDRSRVRSGCSIAAGASPCQRVSANPGDLKPERCQVRFTQSKPEFTVLARLGTSVAGSSVGCGSPNDHGGNDGTPLPFDHDRAERGYRGRSRGLRLARRSDWFSARPWGPGRSSQGNARIRNRRHYRQYGRQLTRANSETRRLAESIGRCHASALFLFASHQLRLQGEAHDFRASVQTELVLGAGQVALHGPGAEKHMLPHFTNRVAPGVQRHHG